MENALKAVSKTDDELVVGNYIALFGGRDLTGIEHNDKGVIGPFRTGYPNRDGSLGEFFTKNTTFQSDYTQTGRLLVDWEHGLYGGEGEPDKDDVLGYVDWKSARIDDSGLWVERVLDRRKAYMQWIEQLVEAGLIGSSTEPVQKGVSVAENGEIKSWPLKRDTLTVAPFEPRMMTQNALQAAKALGLIAEPEPEAEPEAGNGGDAAKAADVVEPIQDPPMEVKTMPDEIETQVNNSIEIDYDALAKALHANQPPPAAKSAGFVKTEGASPGKVIKAEEDTPFESLAAQCRALKTYELTKGQRYAPRLKALKAIAGASETVPVDGGFLLDPTLTNQILMPMHEDGPFSSKVRRLPVSTNSNYGWINGVDETSRATGSRWGGIRGYRLAEGDTKTASKPKFRRIDWELKKYAVLAYGSDELLEDAAMFSAIVQQGAREELNFMLNDDIMNGLGVGGPLGILVSPALYSVPKETGQAADTIVYENLSKMWRALTPRSKRSPATAWYINGEVGPQLDALFIAAGTAGIPPRFVSETPEGMYTIKGKPVIETEFNPALGNVGDIVLSDMSEYLLWQKGDVQFASSIHVEFLTDQSVFRFVVRVDGKPTMASTITPYKANTGVVISSHVALAERA